MVKNRFFDEFRPMGAFFGLGFLILLAILAAIVPAIQKGTIPPNLPQRGWDE